MQLKGVNAKLIKLHDEVWLIQLGSVAGNVWLRPRGNLAFSFFLRCGDDCRTQELLDFQQDCPDD